MAPEGSTPDSQDLEREATIRGLGASGQDIAPFTDAEVQGFTRKLQAWGDGLPSREQELLARIVLAVPAGEEEEDVRGYTLGAMWPIASTSLGVKVNAATTYEIAQDVTVNKAKTADKAFTAMDGYIRG